jgi:hypothetical protein
LKLKCDEPLSNVGFSKLNLRHYRGAGQVAGDTSGPLPLPAMIVKLKKQDAQRGGTTAR